MTQSSPPSPGNNESPIDSLLGKLGAAFDALGKNDEPGKPASTATAADTAAFFRALNPRRIEDLKRLLAKGVDPDATDSNGDTALAIAARKNMPGIAQLLLAAGADPKKPSGKKDEAKLPITVAAVFGHAEIVEMIGAAGGYDPATDANGWTLLHNACEKGHTRIVRALLHAGADPNETTENGATPLIIALKRRHAETAKALLAVPAVAETINLFYTRTDTQRRRALPLAIEGGLDDAAAALITLGGAINAPDASGMTPLNAAILAGNAKLVARLVQAGADLNKNAHPLPLHLACSTPRLQAAETRRAIVDTLLRAGADANIADARTGKTPLMLAAALEDKFAGTTMRLLKETPALDVIDASGKSAVFIAVDGRRTGQLRLLLEAGARPHGREKKKARTPLMTASAAGWAEGCALLVEYKAPLHARDGDGQSALTLAATATTTVMTKAVEQDLLPPARKNKGAAP